MFFKSAFDCLIGASTLFVFLIALFYFVYCGSDVSMTGWKQLDYSLIVFLFSGIDVWRGWIWLIRPKPTSHFFVSIPCSGSQQGTSPVFIKVGWTQLAVRSFLSDLGTGDNLAHLPASDFLAQRTKSHKQHLQRLCFPGRQALWQPSSWKRQLFPFSLTHYYIDSISFWKE